jgi:hypothetical protein
VRRSRFGSAPAGGSNSRDCSEHYNLAEIDRRACRPIVCPADKGEPACTSYFTSYLAAIGAAIGGLAFPPLLIVALIPGGLGAVVSNSRRKQAQKDLALHYASCRGGW